MTDDKPAVNEAIITTIKREAQRVAAQHDLSTESAFRTAVQEQLAQVRGSQQQKRRTTILRLGEAAISPVFSRNDIFQEKDTISQRVFYDKNKDWYHDPHFRQILENVIAIYMRYDSEREMYEMAKEQRAWTEKMKTVSYDMLNKANEMLGFPLAEIELVEEDDGKTNITIMKPANWRVGDIPRIVEAADKVGRLARGMDTDQTAVSVDAVTAHAEKAEEVALIRQSVRTKMQKMQQTIEKQLAANAEEDGDEEEEETAVAEETN